MFVIDWFYLIIKMDRWMRLTNNHRWCEWTAINFDDTEHVWWHGARLMTRNTFDDTHDVLSLIPPYYAPRILFFTIHCPIVSKHNNCTCDVLQYGIDVYVRKRVVLCVCVCILQKSVRYINFRYCRKSLKNNNKYIVIIYGTLNL